MARFSDLRPNLDSLLQSDVKSAVKGPRPKPEDEAEIPEIARAEATRRFAEEVAERHAIEAREVKSREMAAKPVPDDFVGTRKRRRPPA